MTYVYSMIHEKREIIVKNEINNKIINNKIYYFYWCFISKIIFDYKNKAVCVYKYKLLMVTDQW